ncbi:hypothetical protein PIB30_063544 [Stylosanthes scabra]|uniref:Uncharacterized protein n=1 Tax=Stylosanthes scabra TaxID=79078 RepID=A0ABU6SMV2_9FABA|nr:hypothetical protein [Stylosanthes scabra]
MAGRQGEERDLDINRLDRSHHVVEAIGFQGQKCYRRIFFSTVIPPTAPPTPTWPHSHPTPPPASRPPPTPTAPTFPPSPSPDIARPQSCHPASRRQSFHLTSSSSRVYWPGSPPHLQSSSSSHEAHMRIAFCRSHSPPACIDIACPPLLAAHVASRPSPSSLVNGAA